MGAYAVSLQEIGQLFWSLLSFSLTDIQTEEYLLLYIRLPRILLSIIVGSSLAIAGAAIQSVFKNPLADPSLIGVSSGAMLFAVGFIVLSGYLPFVIHDWGHHLLLALAAFVGGLAATWVVYKVSVFNGKTHISSMLLAGIAITALCGGLTGILIYLADEEQLRDITFWNLGSVAAAQWPIVLLLSLILLVAGSQLIRQSKQLEVMQLGDKEAQYLGVEVEATKQKIVLLVVLMVGACVAFTGMIGFVGLVVPHLVRMYFKYLPFRRMIPITALVGGILLLLADTIARTIIIPSELPIGILTSLFGAPFFLYLIIRNKKKSWV